jgi:hypothetical protein
MGPEQLLAGRSAQRPARLRQTNLLPRLYVESGAAHATWRVEVAAPGVMRLVLIFVSGNTNRTLKGPPNARASAWTFAAVLAEPFTGSQRETIQRYLEELRML